MAKKSTLFGKMLSDSIRIISICQDESITTVQKKLGESLGRTGKAVEKWRQGNLPPTIDDREKLASEIIKRSGGYLGRKWLETFLRRVYYPKPEELCSQLFPRQEMVIDEDKKPSIYVVIGTLIEEKAHRFVGREYVFTAIEDFLRQHDRGYFTIEGDPGMGKSAILAKYVQNTGCINHFNIRLQGINSTKDFLENICTQLITRYELPYSELPPEATQDGVFFAALLTKVSRRLEKDEQLVIAIDALDEVDLSGPASSANILYLPPVVPKGVYFVMTRRRMPDLRLTLQAPQEIYNLLDHQSESKRDIETYIRREIDESADLRSQIGLQGLKVKEFVITLTTKSEYNFMYLYYVLPEITGGAYRNFDIEELPIGLEGYYRDHWRRMGMTATPLPRTKIKVVYILSAIRQPVSCRLIANYAEKDPLTVQEVLNEWMQFLHKQRIERQTCYSIYHTSFQDFLHEDETVQMAEVTLPDINAKIALYQFLIFYGQDS